MNEIFCVVKDEIGQIVGVETSIGFLNEIEFLKRKDSFPSGTLDRINETLSDYSSLLCVPRKTYLLMNKDEEVVKFDYLFNVIKKFGNLPYGANSVGEWVSKRVEFPCVKDVKPLYDVLNVSSQIDFAELTRCISLADTFWIKRTYDKISWSSVSPYENKLSNMFSIYGLDGVLIPEIEGVYIAPDVSIDGSFPHKWVFRDDDFYYMKAGSLYSLGGVNSGREPYSEYYACKVAEALGFDCVDYQIEHYVRSDGKIDTVTVCESLTSEDVGLVTAYDLGIRSYKDCIEYCKEFDDGSFENIIDMLFLDCLLVNTDRHFNNISFYVDNVSQDVLKLASIYDNNAALAPRFLEGTDSINEIDSYVSATGESFESLFRLICGYVDDDLFSSYLSVLDNFEFNPVLDITSERLKFLNDLLKHRVEVLRSWLD